MDKSVKLYAVPLQKANEQLLKFLYYSFKPDVQLGSFDRVNAVELIVEAIQNCDTEFATFSKKMNILIKTTPMTVTDLGLERVATVMNSSRHRINKFPILTIPSLELSKLFIRGLSVVEIITKINMVSEFPDKLGELEIGEKILSIPLPNSVVEIL